MGVTCWNLWPSAVSGDGCWIACCAHIAACALPTERPSQTPRGERFPKGEREGEASAGRGDRRSRFAPSIVSITHHKQPVASLGTYLPIMSKLVLRAQRRTLADLSGYASHQARSGGDLRHVDATRTGQNRVLVGSAYPARDMRAAIDCIAFENLNEEVEGLRKTRGKKVAAARLRKGPAQPWDTKNAKPWTELVLTASPGWFRDPGQGPGEWNEARMEAFAERSETILRERFGDDLIHLSLHLDEETPHLHAAVLPTIEKRSKRRGRQRIVSHRQHEAFREPDPDPENILAPGTSYERLQDEFASAFGGLDLDRGEPHAMRQRMEGMEPPEHLSTAQWQVRQAAALRSTSEAREEAARQAEASRVSQARSEALLAGVEALTAERVAYAPADERDERLIWGSQAPQGDQDRRALRDRIRPAYQEILAVGRRMHEAMRRLLAPCEEALAERERAVRRDADFLTAMREQTGRPVDPVIEAVRARYRPHGRDDAPTGETR